MAILKPFETVLQMSTEALQTSANAFPPSLSGQDAHIVDVGRKPPSAAAPPPKSLLQRVQESDSRNWLYYQLFLRQDFDACDIALTTVTEESAGSPVVQSTYSIYMKGVLVINL